MAKFKRLRGCYTPPAQGKPTQVESYYYKTRKTDAEIEADFLRSVDEGSIDVSFAIDVIEHPQRIRLVKMDGGRH